MKFPRPDAPPAIGPSPRHSLIARPSNIATPIRRNGPKALSNETHELARQAARNAFIKNQHAAFDKGAGQAMVALSDPIGLQQIKSTLLDRQTVLELTSDITVWLTPRPASTFVRAAHTPSPTPLSRAFNGEIRSTRLALQRQVARLSLHPQPNAALCDIKQKLQLLLAHRVRAPEEFAPRTRSDARLLKELCDVASFIGVRLVLAPNREAPAALLHSEALLQYEADQHIKAADHGPATRHRSPSQGD